MPLDADLGVIADRVIASGLGLKGAQLPTSPTSPVASDFGHRRQSTASTTSSLAPPSRRRHRPSSADSDRRISAQSFAEKLEKRRATLNSAATPSLSTGQAPLTPKDVHVVFANLEQIAELAQAFSGVLDGARGSEEGVDDDRIGEVFVEMVSAANVSACRLSSDRFLVYADSPATRRVLDLLCSTPQSDLALARARARVANVLARVRATLPRTNSFAKLASFAHQACAAMFEVGFAPLILHPEQD